MAAEPNSTAGVSSSSSLPLTTDQPMEDMPNSDNAIPNPSDSTSQRSNLIKPSRSVADRVCTPLGLFVNTPAGSNANPDIKMPVTITPQPSVSPTPIQQSSSSTSAQETSTPQLKPSASSSSLLPHRNIITPNDIDSKIDYFEKLDAFPTLQEDIPLHTGTVQSNTKIVHPKPIILSSPDVPSRPGTAVSNVAQLEATAERLSMTSSIDDAIRDLHGELKRSDSRRSSMLAASIRDDAPGTPGQLMRHLSTSSSIVSTNIAARHGGYSPAAFVMSPSNLAATTTTGRLRSSSKGSVTMGLDSSTPDVPSIPAAMLSRHGPGKGSVRSVRSVKPSLAEISESEPISLTQDALDQADIAPPIESHDSEADALQSTTAAAAFAEESAMPSTTDAFHDMLNNAFQTDPFLDSKKQRRPGSSQSHPDFEHSHDAFADFDGVHYGDDAREENHAEKIKEQEQEENWDDEELDQFDIGLPDAETTPEQVMAIPPAIPRAIPVGRERPQSYLDPQTGIQMLYYPAKVPSMLKLPQKLSNKPKGPTRNERQRKVLSAMWDAEMGLDHPQAVGDQRRHSAMPQLSQPSKERETIRHSMLPELRYDNRKSFMGLPIDLEEEPQTPEALAPEISTPEIIEPQEASPVVVEAAENHENLRLPQRLSRMTLSDDKRKSRLSQIPAQLRASAYFDMPSVSPEVEIKDGSAMLTLDSILDASAVAPVSAFTDHLHAGKLGSETYGKERKRQSLAPSTTMNLAVDDANAKRRSSFMWLNKRSSSYNSDLSSPKTHSPSGKSLVVAEEEEDHVIRVPAGPIKNGEQQNYDEHDHDHHDGMVEVPLGEGQELLEPEDEEEEDEAYLGPPTTLLAELHLRKLQQKERTKQRGFLVQSGTHATLLEMDAIAETQRVDRKGRRVNLAWEDPAANPNDGSDDEDIPLAILAAKHHGAKNMADVERPMGLMERRDMEDNEPLSHRRARLHGYDPSAQLLARPATMIFSPVRLGETKPAQGTEVLATEEVMEEIEEETLASRRKRLADQEETKTNASLPQTRPVSRAFSEELLSQFGEPKVAAAKEGEEETLGQRRQRLQAEKAARDQEMSYNQPPVTSGLSPQDRKHSLASVLGAHARKSPDLRRQQEMIQQEQQDYAARERDAQMANMRMQMPTSLTTSNVTRSGGYRGGMYNDATGGVAQVQTIRPATAQYPSMYGQNSFGMGSQQSFQQQQPYQQQFQQQQQHQPLYNNQFNAYGGQQGMHNYSQMSLNMYNANPANAYGGGQPQMGMQVPQTAGSMDRVEMWRQSVRPSG